MNFASLYDSKKDKAAEITALLGISASKNKDKVGALFFDETLHYVKPKKGIKHVMVILRDLLAFEGNKKTDYEKAMEYVLNVQKKKAVVFFISDFLNFNSFKLIGLLNKKHDVICIKLNDYLEKNPPDNNFMSLTTLEDGKNFFALGNKKLKQKFEYEEDKLLNEMKKKGVDIITLTTKEDIFKKLGLFFKQRAKRR
jgi:uncharacterized protein (DUF58 family)